MPRPWITGVVALSALVFSAPADAALGRLIVKPISPSVGAAAKIEFQLAARSTPPWRVALTLTPPSGKTSRIRLVRISQSVWRGSFSFPFHGRWQMHVSPINQRLVVVGGLLATRTIVVQLPPASSFAPAGASGCSPASPANSTSREARGTADTGDLWALFFTRLATPTAAVLDGVIGKEAKIVWRLLGSGDATFTATAPTGSRRAPLWVTAHGGSTWTRPGDEWGTGFVFFEAGCWQIHVERSDVMGDLWLLVRS